ncbi:MAG TPA: hypothetical protein ENF34_00530 [Candidatus Bathyarchaeota archaeon]|nr:hypothetical protein [Candidatus Bathyarchaeota archaeon]
MVRRSELLLNFLKALSSNRYSDAERIISILERRMRSRGDWGRGYTTALRGLLSAKKAGDKHAFHLSLNDDPRRLKELRREFSSHSRAACHADFDRGYFAALKELVSTALKAHQAQKPSTV